MRELLLVRMTRYTQFLLLSIFVFAILAPGLQSSQITVSGYVYGTWEADTVLVTGDIQLPPDNNLTISAGTKVLFDGPWQFRIEEYAQITAMGTPLNRIFFGPLHDGDTWRGIRMDFCCGLSIFDYCQFEHAALAGIGDTASGGAIYLQKSSLAIYHSTFVGCSAFNGGAIYCHDHSNPLITDCIFTNDSAGSGGAIFVGDSSRPLIQSCMFTANRSANGGGAIHSEKSSPTISQNQFQYNDGYDGCIRIWEPDTTMRVENNTFTYDSSSSVIHISDMGPWSAEIRGNTIDKNAGIAVYANSAAPIVERNTITNNGSGLKLYFGAAHVFCNRIQGNRGIGIDVYDNTSLTATHISHNVVDQNAGGGLSIFNTTPTVEHNWITRNHSRWWGGVLLQYVGGRFRHNVIAKNLSDSSVGGIVNWDGNLSLSQCIVYGNYPDSPQSITNMDPWIRFDSCDILGGWVYGTGNIDIDPLFRDTANGDFFATSGAITTLPLASCGNEIPDSMEIWINPNATSVADRDLLNLPIDFELAQNYPNPFNPSTTIAFALPYRSHVRLEIYNAIGQLVRTLCDSDLPAGSSRVVWDGRDNKGGDAASGVYFYCLKADNHTIARKMLLLK